jgi:hypothetical protein
MEMTRFIIRSEIRRGSAVSIGAHDSPVNSRAWLRAC